MGAANQLGKNRWKIADAGCAPQCGCTPLFIAAWVGKEALVKVLLQAGADKEATDPVRARRRERGRLELSFEPFPGFLTGFGKPPELECISFEALGRFLVPTLF